MNIVESIGSWGVHTTPADLFHIRITEPRSGDIIEFIDTKYPHIYGKYGRIASIDQYQKGMVHICCELGSAFLSEDGSVDISGGPFEGAPIDRLEPALELYPADYWNWGDLGPGGGHGVHYTIQRPVFKLKSAPPKKDAEEYLLGVPRTNLSPEEKCQACISAQRDTGKALHACDECTYFRTLH
jgi:hypothetical protein